MNKLNKILLITGIAGILAAIGYTVWREYNLLWRYEWWFKNYIVRQLNKSRAVIDFYFDVENKSSLDVTIESYDIDMYAEGVKVAKLTGTRKQLIKANAMSTFSLRADFVPQNVLNTQQIAIFIAAFTGFGDINLQFKGHFNASHSFVKLRKFPFNYTTSLKKMLE